MTVSAQTATVSVSSTALDHNLFRRMKVIPTAKLDAMKEFIAEESAKRLAHEYTVERRKFSTGEPFTATATTDNGDYKEYRPLKAFSTSDAVARLFYTQKIDVARYLNPHGSKTGSETTNLKGINKILGVATAIYEGKLDKVEKVMTAGLACAYIYALNNRPSDGSDKVHVTRDAMESFLRSASMRTFSQGTEEFWSHLTKYLGTCAGSGADTQASQIIRQSVALGIATDIRTDKRKDMILDLGNPILTALMTRLGVIRPVEDAETDQAD